MQRINVGDSKDIPQQTSFDDEGVHTKLGTAVTNSSKIAPVNLEMSFAAEEESKETSDRPGSPWASNKGLYEHGQLGISLVFPPFDVRGGILVSTRPRM